MKTAPWFGAGRFWLENRSAECQAERGEIKKFAREHIRGRTHKGVEDELLAQSELFNGDLVPRHRRALQVIKQLAAASHHQQQPAAGRVILGVRLKVLGKMVDPLGKECYLHISTSRIFSVHAEGLDVLNVSHIFNLFCEGLSMGRNRILARRICKFLLNPTKSTQIPPAVRPPSGIGDALVSPMLTFAYSARDSAGKTIAGLQEALNEDNAVNTLMTRGWMVLSIEQKAGGRIRSPKGKISETDLVLFTRQLATMVDAGLPLVSALTALYEQADPKKQSGLRRVVGEITALIQQGDSFYDAISKHPAVFSRLYSSMVKAGESGGLLSEILDRLASFLESAARLKKKVKSAMTYPVIVLIIALSITTFLIVRVVPVFGEIFADFGAKLPAPTQFLLDLSALIRCNWYYIAGTIAGVIFSIKAFLKTERGRRLWDTYKLKLPIFGILVHKICLTRFARTFAQLIRAGVPILEVMSIVGDTSGNYQVEKAIKNVSTDIEKGDQLANALAREPIFPPMLVRMVGAGEQTGKIDTMLEKMADFWDEEIEATLNALTSLIEPLLIVVLGTIVGGIVISMFLPIFKLSDVVANTK